MQRRPENQPELPERITSWIASFRETHGRSPRVLHLGNVANNAYNNAKLMRQAGLECDVVCCNGDYHVMGCPEWEDADFETPPRNHHFPDWTRSDLNGYRRPDWFVQGPDALCVDYLLARHEGDVSRARRVWQALCFCNGTLSARALLSAPMLWRSFLLAQWSRAVRFCRAAVVHPAPWLELRRRFAGLPAGMRILVSALAFAGVLAMRELDRVVQHVTGQSRRRKATADSLVRRFREEFPQRKDALTRSDLERYLRLPNRWCRLFQKYDIVQAYAVDAVLPLVCTQRYFAFEHGTLRDIPFSETALGRATALAYRHAEHVFVTNHDCLENARALAGDRVSFINHPFDEAQLAGVAEPAAERALLERSLDASLLFFFPTRHDWYSGLAEKANDVFLRAFCRLRQDGHRVGLVCCEWGTDVARSKALLAQRHCERYVKWVAPMGVGRFSRMARTCDVVVDQFRIGALGGVAFKAFAAGAPVLTYLNETALGKIYPEAPPVLNCRTEEEIVSVAERILQDPGELRRCAEASKRWLHLHHRGALTISAQLERYRVSAAA